MVDDLQVVISKNDDSVEVAVAGEIDMGNTERFKQALEDALSRAETSVNLDLVQVPFMASSGMKALLSARRLAAQQGITLRIVRVSPKVERVLDMMALKEFFSME